MYSSNDKTSLNACCAEDIETMLGLVPAGCQAFRNLHRVFGIVLLLGQACSAPKLVRYLYLKLRVRGTASLKRIT